MFLTKVEKNDAIYEMLCLMCPMSQKQIIVGIF